MDFQQRPLAKMTATYFDGAGVLLYTIVVDFATWIETVTNPHNGKSVSFRIDRTTGKRAGRV